MEKKLTVKMTTMPNFLTLEETKTTIPVSMLSEQEANEYAELMRLSFIEHWRKKSGHYNRKS